MLKARHTMNDIRVFFIKEYDSIYSRLSEDAKRKADDYKRKYRASVKRVAPAFSYERSNSDGDSIMRRYDFYGQTCSLSDFEQAFGSKYFIPAPCSPYDCTGRWFTSYLSIFDLRGGHYVAYIQDSCDV